MLIFLLFVCTLIFLWDLATGFIFKFLISSVADKVKNWSSGTLKFLFMTLINLVNFSIFLPNLKNMSVMGYIIFNNNFMTNWISLLVSYTIGTFTLYTITRACSKKSLNKFLYNNVYFSKQKKFKKLSKTRIFAVLMLILPWSAKVVILGGLGFKLEAEDFIKLALMWISFKTLFFAFLGEAYKDVDQATSFIKFNFGHGLGIFYFIVSCFSYIFSLYFFCKNSKYGILSGKNKKRTEVHPLDQSVMNNLNVSKCDEENDEENSSVKELEDNEDEVEKEIEVKKEES